MSYQVLLLPERNGQGRRTAPRPSSRIAPSASRNDLRRTPREAGPARPLAGPATEAGLGEAGLWTSTAGSGRGEALSAGDQRVPVVGDARTGAPRGADERSEGP